MFIKSTYVEFFKRKKKKTSYSMEYKTVCRYIYISILVLFYTRYIKINEVLPGELSGAKPDRVWVPTSLGVSIQPFIIQIVPSGLNGIPLSALTS